MKRISDEDLKRLKPIKNELYHDRYIKNGAEIYFVYALFNDKTKKIEFCSDTPEEFPLEKDLYKGFVIVDPEAVKSFEKAYPDSGLELLEYWSETETSKQSVTASYMVIYPNHRQVKDLAKLTPRYFETLAYYFEKLDEFDKHVHFGNTFEEVLGVSKESLKAINAYCGERIELAQRLWSGGVRDVRSYEMARAIQLENLGFHCHLNDYVVKNNISYKKLLDIFARAELFQALRPIQTRELLDDICKLSDYLHREPDIESNCLKREYDVLARDYRLSPVFDGGFTF